MIATSRPLLAWRDDPEPCSAVAVRGSNKIGRKDGAFGAFCAGGDIRYFHKAALAGIPNELEDFFTEEYTTQPPDPHLPQTLHRLYGRHRHGRRHGHQPGRQASASSPSTPAKHGHARDQCIGLFPDVGGGYFLSRCPGRMGEYLALTGQVLSAADDALAVGLADIK